jgi:hypothetical protein
VAISTDYFNGTAKNRPAAYPDKPQPRQKRGAEAADFGFDTSAPSAKVCAAAGVAQW